MIPSFSTTTHRTARKRHFCTECHGAIEVGEVFEYVWGLWDDEVNIFKTCTHCETARNFYVGDCDSEEFRALDVGAFAFTRVEQDLLAFARACPLGSGLKLGAYRHAVQMKRRREAADLIHHQNSVTEVEGSV